MKAFKFSLGLKLISLAPSLNIAGENHSVNRVTFDYELAVESQGLSFCRCELDGCGNRVSWKWLVRYSGNSAFTVVTLFTGG